MNIKRIGKAIMVLLLATPALSSMELMAQNLKMPTLEDLLPGGATYRIAENLPGLQWWGDVCIKPGIDSLFAVNPKNGKETLLTTREKVNKVLNSLITPTETTATSKYKGYYYVVDAVEMAQKIYERPVKVTKDIYPVIARKYKSTPSNVEHNIRTLVNLCWMNHKDTLEEMAGCTMADKPTNSEFIDILVYYLRYSDKG